MRSSSRFSAGVRELQLEFVLVDRNRDGKVDYAEFKEMLEGLEASMSETDMTIGFHEIDTDKDGFIGRNEFVEWWLTD
jgi:Ca2+-binding EF-hand superfamily protein